MQKGDGRTLEINGVLAAAQDQRRRSVCVLKECDGIGGNLRVGKFILSWWCKKCSDQLWPIYCNVVYELCSNIQLAVCTITSFKKKTVLYNVYSVPRTFTAQNEHNLS